MTKMQMVSTLIKPTLHICHTHIVPKPPSQFRPLVNNKLKILPTIFTPRPNLAPKNTLSFLPKYHTPPKNTFVFLSKSHSSPQKHLVIFTQISLLSKKHICILPKYHSPPKNTFVFLPKYHPSPKKHICIFTHILHSPPKPLTKKVYKFLKNTTKSLLFRTLIYIIYI